MSVVHDAGGQRTALERLVGVDLNLLVAFDALVREQSVTRAAATLGVTQSAVSHALRRLRELLGDPLMVRGRSGMMLTPRATALVMPLRSGLLALGRALSEPAVFEPATARRTFVLAGPDLFDALALPPLLGRLRSEAPGVDLTVTSLEPRRMLERLESGEVDVAVVPRLDGAPLDDGGPLLRRTLLRDGFACYLRAGHPALGKRRPRLDLATYVGLSHAMVSPSGSGPGVVDQALEARGLVRRVALRMPHFATALSVVASSDLVLTAPASLIRTAPSGLPVVTMPAPLTLPDHHVDLLWHERYTSDVGHRWLRELLVEITRGMGIARKRSDRLHQSEVLSRERR